MLKLFVVLAVSIPALCTGFLLGRDQTNWNGLKATWGVNPFTSFQSLPRTKSEAESAGWVAMVPRQSSCTENPKFLGFRYWKDNDMGIILIFDPAGYIAGIQAGVSKDYAPNPNGFPKPQIQNKPMVLDGDTYYITAYFVDPATVCTGRSKTQYDRDGTGEGLWIQNGLNPVTQSEKMPATQAEADQSMWTKGACFYSMGLHYWYNTALDMNCDDFYPVFLLYNKGVLNAFGWAFGINLTNSKHLEHPPQSSYGSFMDPVPKCLASMGTLTTLHIYLTDSATADLC